MSRVEAPIFPLPDISRAVRLPVLPYDHLLIDTLRAGLLRERDLERHSEEIKDAPAVLVDLSSIRSLDVQAAFELLGKWIPNLQRERKKAGKEPIAVIITARHLDILRTVHAALRDSGQTATALIPRELTGEADELVRIGSWNS